MPTRNERAHEVHQWAAYVRAASRPAHQPGILRSESRGRTPGPRPLRPAGTMKSSHWWSKAALGLAEPVGRMRSEFAYPGGAEGLGDRAMMKTSSAPAGEGLNHDTRSPVASTKRRRCPWQQHLKNPRSSGPPGPPPKPSDPADCGNTRGVKEVLSPSLLHLRLQTARPSPLKQTAAAGHARSFSMARPVLLRPGGLPLWPQRTSTPRAEGGCGMARVKVAVAHYL